MSSERISTHAPLAGRDREVADDPSPFSISTHAPLAGRDTETVHKSGYTSISTHAPLAGRDVSWGWFSPYYLEFQPTRPLRGATVTTHSKVAALLISTHAPLAGRDLFLLLLAYISLYFNPRAPCGARQQKCTNHYAHFCDNRQISDAFAQNAACQGILLLFDAGKPCGFWVRTAQVISAHLCFAL